jgi:hypothetical protein
VPRHRRTLVALTAGALALGVADAVPAKTAPNRAAPAATPCKAPATGFQSCLRVLYKTTADGVVDDVRVTATLLRHVETCPARSPKRQVVISLDDGTRLDAARRPGTCRKGVVSWRAGFSAGETAGWELRQGDTVLSEWSGVRNPASVEIGG